MNVKSLTGEDGTVMGPKWHISVGSVTGDSSIEGEGNALLGRVVS